MKQLVILMMCLCFLYACVVQKDLPPPKRKIALITGQGIQYEFPDNIEKSLDEAIKRNEKYSHLIMLETINDSTYTITVYCMNYPNKEKRKKTEMIIKKTGRYYLYKSEFIPIIFDTDYKFSTPGFVIIHGCYWVTFRTRGSFMRGSGFIIQQE